MRGIVSFRRNLFFLKYATGWSTSLYHCDKTAPTAISEESGSTIKGFVKYGSFKIGEDHNTNLNYSKYY